MIVAEDVTNFRLFNEHLMLFELDTNKDELKSGLVWVEGRKDFLENQVKTLMQDKSNK